MPWGIGILACWNVENPRLEEEDQFTFFAVLAEIK
jgi:hypothetical protein